jgi:glycogen operon protein
MQVWPGRPFPLGATATQAGTNFAVASGIADRIVLCLLDAAGGETQLPLLEQDTGVWHGFVTGVRPGQRYGYRVFGPYEPRTGLRCNPNKLLLDPYARAIEGDVTWGEEVLGYPPGNPDGFSTLDSAGHVPVGLVVADEFDWSDDVAPEIPYSDSIIYEVHVKGFTQRHPRVAPDLRGTYAGLATPAAIDHLRRLGVTAVELLPVQHHLDDAFLRSKGLANYWGYSTIGFFAPHAGYSAEVRAGRQGGQRNEFKAMVRALHTAGLEVILDIAPNHTAEGNHLGPTLSFRGLDNAAYYRLVSGDRRFYFDTTGTGNSLNADDPTCLRLIMDALRSWVTEMHVDGFRFDLAVALGREHGGFERVAAFFDLVQQDPIVSRVKLIAEPWDVGQPDSYDVGRFPGLWSEWNGRYRDTARDYWRGLAGTLPDLATRLTGSADLYGPSRRRPNASVNFITCHDGFTLRDLVSYDRKHNEANGESNTDGTDDNRSWNCGLEGPTDDPTVLDLRARQSRAMLATLLLSLGVPMLEGGDEMGRSQQGNNNAYCQDNEISWFDWTAVDEDLLAFTRGLIDIRKRHHALRRHRFVTGALAGDIAWYTPAGSPMTDSDWRAGWTRSVVAYIDGSRDPDRDEHGQIMLDDDLLLLVNGWWEPLTFTLPAALGDAAAPEAPTARVWQCELDTFHGRAGHGSAGADGPAAGQAVPSGGTVVVGPRSVMLLRFTRPAVPATP